jgi:hypothetical protein
LEFAELEQKRRGRHGFADCKALFLDAVGGIFGKRARETDKLADMQCHRSGVHQLPVATLTLTRTAQLLASSFS